MRIAERGSGVGAANDAVLEQGDVEVDQQAEFQTGQFEIREELSFVDRREFVYRLDFGNDQSFHQQIEAKHTNRRIHDLTTDLVMRPGAIAPFGCVVADGTDPHSTTLQNRAASACRCKQKFFTAEIAGCAEDFLSAIGNTCTARNLSLFLTVRRVIPEPDHCRRRMGKRTGP